MAIRNLQQRSIGPFEKTKIEYLKKIIREAHLWEGTPYNLGSKGPDEIDCSGFIVNVFKKVFDDNTLNPFMLNIAALRTSPKFQTVVRPEMGDIVLWDRCNSSSKHGGIVVDPRLAKFIHAGQSNGVKYSFWTTHYWNSNFENRIFRRYRSVINGASLFAKALGMTDPDFLKSR